MQDAQPAEILIVEDDQDIAELLEDGIGAMGSYRTSIVSSGATAIEHLSRHAPDMVLLDIMLKDMDGTDVCRVIKGAARTSDIPVIAVTVIHKREKQRYREIMDSGVDVHVEKPFSFEELGMIIREQLTRKET